jgi:hypothetical protein
MSGFGNKLWRTINPEVRKQYILNLHGVIYMCIIDSQTICSVLMLQEVLEDDGFLEVSSARRLVNISGAVRATDLNFSPVKDMGLLHMHMGLWFYCSAATTMVAEIGTK